MRMILMAIAALTLTGCALHMSGLQDGRGRQTLYVFEDEHDAFAAAHGAIFAVAPDAPIKAVGGPIRGYTVTQQNLLTGGEEATFTVSIVPGTGRTKGGERVAGYFAEVTLKSEGILSRRTAKLIYRAIIESFRTEGRAVTVDKIVLGKYKSAAFLRNSRPYAAPQREEGDDFTPPPTTVADELTKLYELKRAGGLTGEEYDQLKAEILSR